MNTQTREQDAMTQRLYTWQEVLSDRSLTMVRQYADTALWASTDESTPSGGEPMDRNYGVDDIDPDTLNRMVEDCRSFRDYVSCMAHAVAEDGTITYVDEWLAALDAIDNDPERAGHDFWLTRNGHGAGFWDGDWPDGIGELLTQASKRFGEVNLYVGDDGRIYGYPD